METQNGRRVTPSCGRQKDNGWRSHRGGSFGAGSQWMGKSLTRKVVSRNNETGNNTTGRNALSLVREQCISKHNEHTKWWVVPESKKVETQGRAEEDPVDTKDPGENHPSVVDSLQRKRMLSMGDGRQKSSCA